MTQPKWPLVLLAAVSAMALSAAGCSKKADTTTTTQVAANSPPPATAAPIASAEMQKVLDKLASLGGKPIESLDPAEARKQPTPADAVKAVMKDQGMSTAPDPTVITKDITYPAGAGMQKARIYTPTGAKGPLPVVLYIHGGGWVIADIDVYDASPRALAKLTNAIFVSIEYRHAPEAKFPAAHDDANASYKWLLANAAKWGGDPKKVAIVGESAGGNMAIDVAIAARDSGWAKPLAIVAVYPVANTSPDTASKKAFTTAKPLNTPMLDWFFKHTLAKPEMASDPRLNLVGAKLDGLPPTTIILAQIDPLHDDGAGLSDKMRAAGDTVDLKEYAGVTHEFFGMGAVVPGAKAAEDYAAGKLKAAFGT
jgi:acetyl esterase/lipase